VHLLKGFQTLDQRLQGGHLLGRGLPQPGLVGAAEPGDTCCVRFVRLGAR
jgi:hypothetical protein